MATNTPYINTQYQHLLKQVRTNSASNNSLSKTTFSQDQLLAVKEAIEGSPSKHNNIVQLIYTYWYDHGQKGIKCYGMKTIHNSNTLDTLFDIAELPTDLVSMIVYYLEAVE